MGIKYKINTGILLLATVYYLFTETRYLIPSKKEIANQQDFADHIIFEAGRRLGKPDTLYLVTEKRYAVCGTGMKPESKLSRRFQQFIDVLQEPYYISADYFKPQYEIDGRTIYAGTVVTGSEGCDCLIAGKQAFPLSSILHKELYTIEPADLSKDSAIIHLKEYEQNAIIEKFRVTYDSGKWILAK